MIAGRHDEWILSPLLEPVFVLPPAPCPLLKSQLWEIFPRSRPLPFQAAIRRRTL